MKGIAGKKKKAIIMIVVLFGVGYAALWGGAHDPWLSGMNLYVDLYAKVKPIGTSDKEYVTVRASVRADDSAIYIREISMPDGTVMAIDSKMDPVDVGRSVTCTDLNTDRDWSVVLTDSQVEG